MRAALVAAQVCLLQHFLQQDRLQAADDSCESAIRAFPAAGEEAAAAFCRVGGKLLYWATVDGSEPFGASCGDIWVGAPPCCDALKAAAEAQCGMGLVTDAVECEMDTRVWTGGGAGSLLPHDRSGVMVKGLDVAVASAQFDFGGKALLCSLFQWTAPTTTTTTTTTTAAPGKGRPLWHAVGSVAGGGEPDQQLTHEATTTSLYKPSGLAFDGEALYVADTYNHRVVRFPPGGAQGTVVAGNNGPGRGLDQLWNPVGLAVDSGVLYVACLRSGAVYEWQEGQAAGKVVLDGLFHPAGLVLRPGVLYVSDAGEHKVVRYALATKELTVVAGGEGHGLDELRGPQGIALDAQGAVYIADSQNHRVMKYSPGAKAGTVVAGTGVAGPGLDQLHTPTGVTVDGAGTVIVVEDGNPRVTAWPPGAAEGILLAGGSEGSGAEQLARHPLDLKLDPAGALYIADRDNNRVVKWAP